MSFSQIKLRVTNIIGKTDQLFACLISVHIWLIDWSDWHVNRSEWLFKSSGYKFPNPNENSVKSAILITLKFLFSLPPVGQFLIFSLLRSFHWNVILRFFFHSNFKQICCNWKHLLWNVKFAFGTKCKNVRNENGTI